MPYGLKNSLDIFRRLTDWVIESLPHCVVYIDNVVIYDTAWQDHLANVEALLA